MTFSKWPLIEIQIFKKFPMRMSAKTPMRTFKIQGQLNIECGISTQRDCHSYQENPPEGDIETGLVSSKIGFDEPPPDEQHFVQAALW